MNVLLVLHLMIVILLVILILLQRSASDGFTGGGSSGGEGIFSSRGKANTLSRATAILATLFIGNSLLLAYLYAGAAGQNDVLDQLQVDQEVPSTLDIPSQEQAPTVPSVPLAE